MVRVKVASFNVLADSLAFNEFICEGGDVESCDWSRRGIKLVDILSAMLQSCDIVVTQEIDQFTWICESMKLSNVGFILGQSDKSSANIGLFYNKAAIKLLQFGSYNEQISSSNKDCQVITATSGFIQCVFEKDNVEFNIFGCHLKSGEGYDCELKRIKQLSEIFSLATQCRNPIIAMDSNNSKEYEMEYNGEVDTSIVIHQHGFVDVFENSLGFECFKMRHNGGNQPKKYFQFMFDRIDKILVKSDCPLVEVSDESYGFQRYNIAHWEKLHEIRINATKRTQLKQFCEERIQLIKSNTTPTTMLYDSKEIFVDSDFQELMELYPSLCAPSDHPPLSCTVEIV